MNVTILGGTGPVGRSLCLSLLTEDHKVVITSRSAGSQPDSGAVRVRADLTSGEGLDEAIANADCVVHLASDPHRSREVDVEGTGRLLERLDDQHLIYLSIVGVDRHPLPYYRSKHAAELAIETAAVHHTILRATQFHDFVAYRMARWARPPIARVPRGYLFQPIDIHDVVTQLAALVEMGPQRRAPDVAGPEVLRIEHLARTYMEAKGIELPLISMPKFGKVARAYREGAHTNPDRAVGTTTWAEHLRRRFG